MAFLAENCLSVNRVESLKVFAETVLLYKTVPSGSGTLRTVRATMAGEEDAITRELLRSVPPGHKWVSMFFDKTCLPCPHERKLKFNIF